MAVMLGGKARLRRTKSKDYDTVAERIEDIVKYWFAHGSKFYTQQTVDHQFKVYIVYSKCYEKIVRSFTFPEWCILTESKDIDKINNPTFYTEYNNQQLSVTRVDADDWYSNDYFEYLSRDHKPTDPNRKLTTHLHKWIRLYDRTTGQVSTPQHFSSPGFASMTFNSFNTKHIPMRLALWPHGNIKRRPHTTPEDIYGIQSVGCNVVNKWRYSCKPEPHFAQLDRFYIPK
jgi:hypothetical protein